MHSAMFVVSVPSGFGGPNQDHQVWMTFLGQFIPKIDKATNVLRLGENVWLVDLTVSPAPLAYMIAAAENQKFAYGILPFDAAPQWLPGDFDPKTIRGRNAD